MHIIDINTAIGASSKAWRFTDEVSLISNMDDYRIGSAVAWHTRSQADPYEGNARMTKIASASGGRILPCLFLDSSLDDLGLPGTGSVQDRLRAANPSAVRVLQGAASHFCMNRFYAQDLLAPLNGMRMPLIIDGDYSREFLFALPDMAAAYPDIPMILLRFGFNESRAVYPLLKHASNIYFDMSTMIDCGCIEEIVRKFGSDRLLFGSGLPHYVPAGPLGLLLYARISETDRENIAHANFERLEGGILR